MLDELGTVAAVADGAGDGAAPASIEPSAPAGIEPAPSGDAPDGEVPAEGAEAVPAPGKEGEEEPAPEEEGEYERDGQKMDQTTRKALADLKKVNPQAARHLADTYFRTNAIIKDVGANNLSDAVNKVRQMAATMDSLGGEEGITALNEEVGDYRREIEQFAAGDPTLLQQLQEGNPESFATAIVNGLELIATKGTPEAFDKVIFPAMVARLESSGIPNVVTQIMAFCKEGKGQEAYDLAEKLDGWLKQAKGFSEKQLKLKTEKNPEQERLANERAEFEQQKRDDYTKNALADVSRLNNGEMGKVTATFFKDVKLPPEGRAEFNNALRTRVWNQMAKDEPYKRAAKAIQAKGDMARHVDFMHKKFLELLPDTFRTLRNQMYPNYKPAKGPTLVKPVAGTNGAAKPAAAAPAVATNVTKRPTRDEVDWSKTDELNMITGKGVVLKNGKRINFDPKLV